VLRHVMRGCARTFMLEILLAPLWLSSSTSEPYLRATLSLRTCICFPEAVDERAEAVGVSSVPALLDAILKDDAPPRPSPSKQLAQICIVRQQTRLNRMFTEGGLSSHILLPRRAGLPGACTRTGGNSQGSSFTSQSTVYGLPMGLPAERG
jgi:hypothetical protein